MTYTLTAWVMESKDGSVSCKKVETARGLSDRGVLALYDSVMEKGGFCVITNEDGLEIDPNDLRAYSSFQDKSC